jgi:hypothetical protein
MAEKVAIGPNGERVIFRSAVNESTGETQWFKVPDIIGGASNAYAQMAKNLSESPENVLEDRRSAQSKQLAQMANELSPFDEAMVEAGQVATGFGTGLKSASMKTAGVLADVWGQKYPWLVDPETGIKLYQKTQDLDESRAREQELMTEFNQEKGLPAIAGGMLPYMLTSAFAGPMSKKVAGSTLDALESTTELAKTEAKGLLNRTVNAAANSAIPGIKQFGRQAQIEWTEPLAAAKEVAKKQQPWMSAYRKGTVQDVLGSTALGAAEGAVNSDLDAGSGAIGGLSGGVLGRSLKYKLEPAPLPNKPAYNELMAHREAWGRRNTPGEKLDNPSLQTMIAGLRNADETSLVLKNFDDANRLADNAHAFKAMGYEGNTIIKDSLNAFSKALSAEYNLLASKTTARLDQSDLSNLRTHAMSLAGQSTDEGIQAAKAANDWLNKLKTFRKQQSTMRRVNGQFDSQVEGKIWQDLRSELEEDIKAAFKSGKPNVGRALKPFLDTLNGAADRGIARLGRTEEEGLEILANWKDLDERYAMSKILKEHGLDDVTLNVNPTKLYNYFRTEDPERLITGNYGKNGRINALYDIAEGRPVDIEQAGSTLSGLSVTDKGKKQKTSLAVKLMQSPDYQKPGALNEALLRLHLSPGWSPAVHGYSFGALNGKGPRSAVNLARSFAQSSQFTPSLVNGAIDIGKDTYDFAQHPMQTIQDMIANVINRK